MTNEPVGPTTPVLFATGLNRSQLELTGKDRASFLHGLCTNDIKRLAVEQGCEAFFTNLQGKTLGHGYVFCRSESLVIDTVAGQTATLLAHFDRYLIREDVQFRDHSADWDEWLVTGSDGIAVLQKIFGAAVPTTRLAHCDVAWQGTHVSVRAVDYVQSPAWFVSCPIETSGMLKSELLATGVIEGDFNELETLRIEAGTPRFGQDIASDNLPQEVARNAFAISFTKGCYLGQETIARIDAMGHVNRTLCGVRFLSSTMPAAGTELFTADKLVGKVTSATFSSKLASPLALAYVRRGSNAVGTQLTSTVGIAEVIKLPGIA